jgi:hypothetical protein
VVSGGFRAIFFVPRPAEMDPAWCGKLCSTTPWNYSYYTDFSDLLHFFGQTVITVLRVPETHAVDDVMIEVGRPHYFSFFQIIVLASNIHLMTVSFR